MFILIKKKVQFISFELGVKADWGNFKSIKINLNLNLE